MPLTRSQSQSQRGPPRKKARRSARLNYAEAAFLPFDSESAYSAETTDAGGDTETEGLSEPLSRAVRGATRRTHNEVSDDEDTEDNFSEALRRVQTLWESSKSENAELRDQLRSTRLGRGHLTNYSTKRQQAKDAQTIKELKERVYTLMGDNAELRLENRTLLEQVGGKRKRSPSVSDSEPGIAEKGELARVALAQTQREISPEIELLQPVSKPSHSASDKEHAMKTVITELKYRHSSINNSSTQLFRRFYHIMNDAAKNEATKSRRQGGPSREKSWNALRAIANEWADIEPPDENESEGEVDANLPPGDSEEQEVEVDVILPLIHPLRPTRSSSRTPSGTPLATPPETPMAGVGFVRGRRIFKKSQDLRKARRRPELQELTGHSNPPNCAPRLS
ncbi:hypothetical protein EVJ58_g8468 [Rhodofomes roseus]|uniref:Uncharacterized protein n=1 Tax=Rhodofomes roseus TaxID=34475 RepID=A0A4Y9Y2H8_9APHY|nr:hypothetical protein EVJ58_g8468 [Rhodofomes roseus]